jgi:26S proteasome regulatory subunit N6
MTSTEELLKQAEDFATSNPKRAEELYKQILNFTGMLEHQTS